MSEPITENDVRALLDYLKNSRGFDFTGYKRAAFNAGSTNGFRR